MNVAYFVVQQTMYFAIPLLIVAIGAMYSERSGVINIALEGIMVMGAFAGIFFINIFQGTLSGQGLLIVAIGAMYSERSGVINIALEGIMVMGAFAGIFFINIFQGTLSGQGLFLLAMLVAGLTGGLFSLLHAFACMHLLRSI